MAITPLTKNNGLINLSKEIPADLIATSSKLSPRFPKVINEDNNTARGNARGTKTALWYKINSRIKLAPSPFPTKSSIYNQKNCMMSTSNVIKNVAIKGPTKAFTISLSSFLNTYLSLLHEPGKNKAFTKGERVSY